MSAPRSVPDVEQENARLRAEVAALETALGSARDLLATAPAFFGFVSPSGAVLDLNDLALRVIGAARAEVVGATFWDAPWWRSIPASARRVREAVERAAGGEASRFDAPYWAATPGDAAGQTRWVALDVTPVRDAGGRVARIAISGVDITERNAAESALAVERFKLDALFRGSPAAMALWRGYDLVYEMVNPAYQSIFTDRPLLGLPLLEALPELSDQPFAQNLRRVLETGEPMVGVEVLARIARRRDGPVEDRYFDVTYLRVCDADGRPYGVYDHALDVTERVLGRRAAEDSRARLEASVRDLEQERELRERFVAALSHDLRTPLTAVKLGAQVIARTVADPAQSRKLAGRIVRNIDRADGMIRDLLDASRIKAGETVALDIAECDLNEVVRATLDDLASVHGDRFVLDAARAIRGWWDCPAIQRVVENLAGNAVKYGAPQTLITVRLLERDGAVEIAVHNVGEPIAAADQAGLFEPFHRVESAARSGAKGWGIGLMLVRGLAEAHGGTARVRSAAGEGTTFSVSLPCDARRAP